MIACIIHEWSEWKDVSIEDELKVPHGWPYPFLRQVIRQQKRCARCNLVKTRRA